MLKNVKAFAIAAVLTVSSVAFSATPFQIKVDLNVVPESGAPVMKVPAGAKAAVDRYFRFAERTHPLVLTHSYAARPDKKNKAERSFKNLPSLKLGCIPKQFGSKICALLE